MALGIVVTAVNTVSGSENIAYKIDVSGLTGFQKYKITRLDQGTNDTGGVYQDAPVRSADFVDVIANTATVYDYEAPLNNYSKFRLDGYVGGVVTSTITSSSVYLDNAGNEAIWIKNVIQGTAINVMLGDFSDVRYDPTILGEYKLLGRPNPVVFTDVFGARSGTFDVLAIGTPTYDLTTNETEVMLISGDVLLLQSSIHTQIIKDMYFTVMGLGRSQYNKLVAAERLDFTYNVDFQEVDRPPTEGQVTGFGTWGDLAGDTAYTTWGDVNTNFATWLAVLQHYSE